jgi:putative ABC transport system permease protein
MDSTQISRRRKKTASVNPAPHSLHDQFVVHVVGFVLAIVRLIGTLFTIGFSVLPLAAMLVALPAVSPNEAVLTDTVRPAKSWWRRTARRMFAVITGMVVLIALFAFSIEVISHLPLPEGGQLGTLAKKVLGFAFTDFMPEDPAPSD